MKKQTNPRIFLLVILGLNLLLGSACLLGEIPPDVEPVTCIDRSDSTTQVLPIPNQSSLPGHIAFLSDRDGTIDLYRMKANGNELQRLTHNDLPKSSLIGSPDGKWLAFISSDKLYGLDLTCAQRNDGCRDQDLVVLATGVTEPNWAANSQVIYATLPYPKSLIPGGSADIVEVFLDGRAYQPMHLGTAFPTCGDCAVMKAWKPSASPRGTVLLMKQLTYPGNQTGWSTLYFTTTPAIASSIFSLMGNHPAWSPDESQIAWETSDGLCSQKIDGSEPPTVSTPGQVVDFPSYSPDGKWIAFESAISGNMEIYVMAAPAAGTVNANGKSQLNLTQNPAFDTQPVWTR